MFSEHEMDILCSNDLFMMFYKESNQTEYINKYIQSNKQHYQIWKYGT